MIFILFVAFFHFVCIENGFVADGIEKRKKNKCSLSNAIVCLIDWFDLNTMCMFLRMEFNLSTHTVNRWRKDKNRKKAGFIYNWFSRTILHIFYFLLKLLYAFASFLNFIFDVFIIFIILQYYVFFCFSPSRGWEFITCIVYIIKHIHAELLFSTFCSRFSMRNADITFFNDIQSKPINLNFSL